MSLGPYLKLTHLLKGSRCGDSSVLVLASSSEALIPVKTTLRLYWGGAVQAETHKLVSNLDAQCCSAHRRSDSKTKQNNNKNSLIQPKRWVGFKTSKLIFKGILTLLLFCVEGRDKKKSQLATKCRAREWGRRRTDSLTLQAGKGYLISSQCFLQRSDRFWWQSVHRARVLV